MRCPRSDRLSTCRSFSRWHGDAILAYNALMRGSWRGARLWDGRPTPGASGLPRPGLLRNHSFRAASQAPFRSDRGGTCSRTGGEDACGAWGWALPLSRCKKRPQDLRRRGATEGAGRRAGLGVRPCQSAAWAIGLAVVCYSRSSRRTDHFFPQIGYL